MKFSARKDNAMLFGVVDLPRRAFFPIFFDHRISGHRHLPQRANGRSAAAGEELVMEPVATIKGENSTVSYCLERRPSNGRPERLTCRF